MASKPKTQRKSANKKKTAARSKLVKAAAPAAGLTRRGFMQGVGVAGGVAVIAKDAVAAGSPKTLPAKKVPITLNVNGKDHKLKVEPRVTLLRALRNELDLTGSKEVCDRGACGACSVHLDGMLVTSCMTLAVDAVGKKVTTIEGLAKGDKLDPIQAAFVQHDALQCGFCTPGMVMACKALLNENKSPTLVQIKKGLSGNICRCGTYNHIFAAVQTAAKNMG
jgi:aerobic-type carbon monoxide dehydrogenase small subunit (CoxS/CutS family)